MFAFCTQKRAAIVIHATRTLMSDCHVRCMEKENITGRESPASLTVSASVAIAATLLAWLGLDWQASAVLAQAVVGVVVSALWLAVAFDVYVRATRAVGFVKASNVARLSQLPPMPRPSHTPERTRLAA